MLKEEQVEILVEERSMEVFLQQILPRILPSGYILGQNCFIRPHSGRTDLLKSLSRKAKAFQWFPQPVRMVVLHDQDSHNCIDLKQELTKTVRENNSDIPLLVRIACRELENWYLGDLQAVEKVYPSSRATQHSNKAKYRFPDHLHGAEEMKRLAKAFQKRHGAQEMPAHMDIRDNRSQSFQQFLKGLLNFLT